MKANKQKQTSMAMMVLTAIAILVMFVPVVAVQQIEARAISHAVFVEGRYVNGTAVDILDIDNDTAETVESWYPPADANYSADADSFVYLNAGGVNQDLLFRDRATYSGNGSYAMTYNVSEESGVIQQRKLYIPLDMNITDFMSHDFYRIQSDWEFVPYFYVKVGLSSYEIGTPLEVADDVYIIVNTIQTKSMLQSIASPDAQVWIYYNAYAEPETEDWTLKVQYEDYAGADILTWNDETIYIMAVMLCDVMLWGAILFASDPIDIKIDRPGKRR